MVFYTGQQQVSDSTYLTLPYLTSSASMSSSWQWPSCKQPRTLSFRQHQHHMSTTTLQEQDDSAAGSTNSEAEAEAVLCALRSDRLFFEEPRTPASSLLANMKVKAFEGATPMTMESSNPYRDFRASMEEMVTNTSEGVKVKDWAWLEEMLGWYLRANGKSTHGLIVSAFVDLLVALRDDTATASPSSPTSSCCSACSSLIKEEEEEEDRVVVRTRGLDFTE